MHASNVCASAQTLARESPRPQSATIVYAQAVYVLPHIRLAQGFTSRPHDKNIALASHFHHSKICYAIFVKRSATKIQFQNSAVHFDVNFIFEFRFTKINW